MIDSFTLKFADYLVAFAGSLALTLVLTPLVREINRRIGMVDKPDPRRINKVPIPRGGGVALFLGVIVSYSLFSWISNRPALFAHGLADSTYMKLTVIATFVTLVGLADDRYSLPPKLKLLGQLVAAALVWWWADLGFGRLWPTVPAWLDLMLTVFWITGAVNAFNLIDGLDGLASGLALIATIGMGGSLFMLGSPQAALFHFAFAGGLVGFLRYNYNPASVFLGDSGSMFIGFTLSVMPLVSQTPNSFLVSVGVPMLAMGVPIFDTSLAILRRSIRRILVLRESGDAQKGEVMAADSDHLHHRILRASGLNQRKAAWALYALAASAVTIGLVGMSLESRSAGLWLFAVAAASVIVFRDMARIELFDAGRLLNSVAHDRTTSARRRWARLAVPFYLTFDLLALTGVFLLCVRSVRMPLTLHVLRVNLPIYVVAMFVALFFFRTYRTIWSRALPSNFVRLLLACAAGGLAGAIGAYYAPGISDELTPTFSLLFTTTGYIALVIVRIFRGIVRDIFYAIDCSRLIGRKDVSRILVYGAGLRYRTFRRELVRRTAANDRIIVGLIDDDLLLRGQYIGGIRILGTIQQAPEIINETNADTVVIACEITPEWLRIVRELLRPTGVKISLFTFSETPIEQA